MIGLWGWPLGTLHTVPVPSLLLLKRSEGPDHSLCHAASQRRMTPNNTPNKLRNTARLANPATLPDCSPAAARHSICARQRTVPARMPSPDQAQLTATDLAHRRRTYERVGQAGLSCGRLRAPAYAASGRAQKWQSCSTNALLSHAQQHASLPAPPSGAHRACTAAAAAPVVALSPASCMRRLPAAWRALHTSALPLAQRRDRAPSAR